MLKLGLITLDLTQNSPVAPSDNYEAVIKELPKGELPINSYLSIFFFAQFLGGAKIHSPPPPLPGPYHPEIKAVIDSFSALL